MNKKAGFIFLAFLGVIVLASFASAQYWGMDFSAASYQWIQWTQDILGPFFSVFLGGGGELLFERILFFFIIISIVYLAVGRIDLIKNNTAAHWIVTVAVSILSTRYLTELTLMQWVLMPYGLLGISLTAGLPIIILFFFINSFDNEPVIRKALWIISAVIYFGVWMSRYNEIGSLGWIYFIAGIISLIFFIADGTIRRALLKQQRKQLELENVEAQEIHIREQINKVQRNYDDGIITESQRNRLLRRLKNDIVAIHKA